MTPGLWIAPDGRVVHPREMSGEMDLPDVHAIAYRLVDHGRAAAAHRGGAGRQVDRRTAHDSHAAGVVRRGGQTPRRRLCGRACRRAAKVIRHASHVGLSRNAHTLRVDVLEPIRQAALEARGEAITWPGDLVLARNGKDGIDASAGSRSDIHS